ncbi:MAG: T9SS type A sorting domain-containing protein [Bacteroidetes bacterium]|nr:T9SS type A sorting domain-containing protein [Bacteroidota bacterium]MBU1718497.1 T9SS type A sorting domain-containing protein [Bacteroidota bacterium]
MKKNLLFAIGISLLCSGAFAQQDTIIGWNFIDSNDTLFYANIGLPDNLTYNISAKNEANEERALYLTNGATDNAATVIGWHNGMDDKYWQIRFKADGFVSFHISSKQRSGNNPQGPKDWKMQCKKGGSGTWEDIPGGVVTVGNDWTLGAVADLALPASMDNPGTQSIFVRWIMTSNDNLGGTAVDSLAISKIDDILVTATTATGIETTVFSSALSVYPNPASGVIHVETSASLAKIEMINLQGMVVKTVETTAVSTDIEIQTLLHGIYFLKVSFNNCTDPIVRKLFVE